jgi:hypothetical protein
LDVVEIVTSRFENAPQARCKSLSVKALVIHPDVFVSYLNDAFVLEVDVDARLYLSLR